MGPIPGRCGVGAGEANKVTRSKDKSTSDGKGILQSAAQVAVIVAAIGALGFGYLQYRINDALMRMNQTVAVTGVVEDGQRGELLVRNTGRANLYLAGFALGDKHWAFSRPVLVAANTGGDPGYPIRPGKDLWGIVSENGSATLVLFLTDDSGAKWVSEIGFFKADDNGGVRLCSHETSKESWKLVLSGTRSTSDHTAEYVEGAHFDRGVTPGD